MAKSGINKLSNFVADRFGVVIAIILALTMLQFYFYSSIDANTSSEAMNSDTEIHQAWKRYEESFRPSMHGIPFVLEAKDGNIMNMEEFRDIADALNIIKNDTKIKPMLLEYFDDTLFMNVSTVSAIPGIVEPIMNGDGPYGIQIGYHNPPDYGNKFADADDDDLNMVLSELLLVMDSSGNAVYQDMLSNELKEVDGRWSAPVMMLFITVDNDLLEVNYTYTPGGEDGKEYFEVFDLYVMDILKNNIETCEVYGVGVGIETQINDEILESGPFIMFTFIIIIIILAVVFRHNFKSFLAGTIGLPMIVLWMLGTERILFLSKTTFNAFLPVLIMALGVDYAIHSMKRFEEELVQGKSPRQAVKGSVLKLTGTLALAMLTTFVAFFSNFFSTIPALRDWGIEAALAIAWTFLIMGLFVPALRLGMESKKYRDVSYSERLKVDKKKAEKLKKKHEKLSKNRLGNGLVRMTRKSVAHPSGVGIVLVLIALPLGYGAINIGTDFAIEDFFSADSDLVVGLEIYTEHFPEGGEPNILLIEGDIQDPEVVEAIETTISNLDSRGYATYSVDIAQIVVNFTENLAVNNMVGGKNIQITDSDQNGIPDDKSEIHEIYKQISEIGLFSITNGKVFQSMRPDMIEEILFYDSTSDSFEKTVVAVGVSGSGSLDNIKVGIDNMKKDASEIVDTGKAEIYVTGSAPLRLEQLTAISMSLFYSIIISIIVCFIILLAVFKRLGFSMVAILPVILIAVLLYGIMFYTGYDLNIVTASIGAMSIGVGVDYSIHVCDRYRKEKVEGRKFDEAMDETIANSGAALLFAALTTMFGFFVLLFAPMPMFFSFGLFSGLMVLLAFIASVIIVPPLLRLSDRG